MAKTSNSSKKVNERSNPDKKIIIMGIVLLIIAILIFNPSLNPLVSDDPIDSDKEEEIFSEDTNDLLEDHLDEALEDINNLDSDLL